MKCSKPDMQNQASGGRQRRGTGRSPILVVAPKTIQDNWMIEMNRWGASSTARMLALSLTLPFACHGCDELS